jgi:hypothetical protein
VTRSCSPESRTAYHRLLSQGWTDAVRALHPKEPMYTFWDYMRKRWERDFGLRLDHILLSSALTERLQSAGVDRHIRGMEDASDHAPVWVDLRDAPNRPSSASLVGSHATTAAAMPSPKAKKSDGRTGGEFRSQTRAIGEPELSRRPLLVIDGDSFAHRSYHALPNTIRRSDGKGAALSSASPISCCGSTRMSGPAPSLSDGTPWTRRQSVAKCFPPIRAGASSLRN